MDIGIPKEVRSGERRVGLPPAKVGALVTAGHRVSVERGAGEEAGYPDEKFAQFGANIVFSAEEAFKRAELIVKVGSLAVHEYEYLVPDQVVMAHLALPVTPKKDVERMLEHRITAIGYEMIEDEHGDLPVLTAMSEIAGQLSISIACQYLRAEYGGRGLLLGGIPGVPPATVVIVGAGVVGTTAARAAIGLGAQVAMLDLDVKRLRRLDREFSQRVISFTATKHNMAKAISFADVLIGAVLIHGEEAPDVVTEEMVKSMKPGSVILDVSIDQGGCVATSRPTTHADPTFVKHGVIHYCVPNIPATVPRTSSHSLANQTLPYVNLIANNGIEKALQLDPALRKGVATRCGKIVDPKTAMRLGVEPTPVEKVGVC
jgi:alanine dehydrogenase